MYGHLSLSCQVTHKRLKKVFERYMLPRRAKCHTDASCYYDPAAAIS
jgi:hypothetical protein